MSETIFLILFRTEEGEYLARTVIESLRAFGGSLCQSPVWAFCLNQERAPYVLPGIERIKRFSLVLEDGSRSYPFAEKVYVCAKAETMSGPQVRSLVLLSLDCLVVNPPILFDLTTHAHAPQADAAFRPVHHRNIGSLAGEPLDMFWQGIYQRLEIDQMPFTIESYADQQFLRPYFNSHCFAFNPALGLGQAWWEAFQALVADQSFQSTSCSDDLHKIFLHQAVLSTIVVKTLPWERIRQLPPEYNFPLNLLDEIPEDRKPKSLNSLVNAVYEEAFPWGKIEISEPLYTWLRERLQK